MKKLILLLLAAVAIVYGIGALRLSERGANDFLVELEAMSLRGEMGEYCDRLHEELEVSIQDRTADSAPRDLEGGKAEYCGFVTYATKGLDLLGLQTNVTRENFTVERSWLHPWTAHVSYHEVRTSTMSRVNVVLHTESDDRWTLVNTFAGVKVRRLESKSYLVQ